MSGASMEVDRVEVDYGSVKVLKQVSLAVRPGEFVALLGSSGCGKTTLLRAISGFVPVASGRILVDGQDIAHLPPDKRGMAMVFQSYALWPHMTAAGNIGYGLKLRGWDRPRIAERVGQVLAMLKLDGLGERMVAQLSGGQRQRVALGRALAIDPGILLLDEPLSNLDARIREDVRHEIKALQNKLGITTIHVTHDREEAMVMADRIVIMEAGLIAQVGAPEEVYNRPASAFVASFMGAGNVLALTAREDSEGLIIRAGDHSNEVRVPRAHLMGTFGDSLVAHFRGEAARLGSPDTAPADRLVLQGRIEQSSYPGGHYRYAVAVGSQHFMIDDARRLAVGEAVGIGLPLASLHLFAAPSGGVAEAGQSVHP
jgi:putative spermidine/putrescine transport system ATP-binding protein